MNGGLANTLAVSTLRLWSHGGFARNPLWSRVAALVSGHRSLACADQALVSAANFLALIMIGRSAGVADLGMYAIGTSIVAVLLASQESLVTRPYTINLHNPSGTPAEHAFSSLLLSLLLSGTGACLLGASALGMMWLGFAHQWVFMVAVLAGVAPLMLLREFARRYAFAHLKMAHALTVDLSAAGLSVALLAWLAVTDRLDAATAFGAIGTSCGCVALAWLYLSRSQFAFALGPLKATLRQSWQLGKWLFSGQLALQVQGYMTHWLSMVLAGAAITGIFTACSSVVALSNPLLFGLFNVFTPKSVRAYRTGGGAALRRQALWDSLLMAGLMIPFCVVIFFAGDTIMQLFFKNAVYTGNATVLTVLALAALASAVGAPASIALAASGRARAVAGVMTLAAGLNLVLVAWFISLWGLLGAACGVLIAETTSGLCRWIALLTLVSATGPDTHDPTGEADSTPERQEQ